MGITFEQLCNRLIGAVDAIPNSFAGEAVNQALRHIYDERDWGFLWKTGYIRTPAIINGNAATTKFSDIVILDAATRVLVDALVPEDVSLEERQVRFYGTNKASRNYLYNIVDYDNATGALTLDRPYFDDTDAVVRIQIIKAYYTAPTIIVDGQAEIDFRRFEYIYSHQLNRKINLHTTLDELNQFDPTRSRLSSPAYPAYFVPFSNDEDGNVLYEFYPHPTVESIFEVRYLSNGRELKRPTDQVPSIITMELVLSKAKQKAYEWLIANSNQKQIKVSSGLTNMIAMLENRNNSSSYPRLLELVAAKDEELFPQAYLGTFSNADCVDYLGDYNPCYPHDRFGDTLVIDAAAPTIEM